MQQNGALIIDENGNMIGDIHFSGKDCKIIIGNNSPLVIDACLMLRNAVVEKHRMIA
jgi:hypothetical protein